MYNYTQPNPLSFHLLVSATYIPELVNVGMLISPWEVNDSGKKMEKGEVAVWALGIKTVEEH